MRSGLKLPKASRITRGGDFKRILIQGKKIRGDGLNIYVLQGERRSFGISINRKIKGAVKRNRIKRIFKEYLRLNQERFGKEDQVLVIVLKEIKNISLLKVKEIVNNAFGDHFQQKNGKNE